MKLLSRSMIVIWLVTGLVAFVQAQGADFNLSEAEKLGVTNLHVTSATSLASGQPSGEQLAALAGLGVRHVISLRPASEMSWDEKAEVEKLGMRYHNIAVAGKSGITVENARKLNDLLTEIGDEPLLLHCSSGNRVGGLIALGAYHIQGAEVEVAVNKGKDWGLTRLESFVRTKLQ